MSPHEVLTSQKNRLRVPAAGWTVQVGRILEGIGKLTGTKRKNTLPKSLIRTG